MRLKRAFDIPASFFGLVFLSPAFLVISLLIRLDSPGPVFFRSRRAGRNEKEFTILKFRTMYENPESYQGLPVTTNGDKRITPFGRWLRDTKMNELPQLWNVLVGDMSLVGPRPEDCQIVKTWPEEVRREVLSVRPGMTSPASIIYRDEEKVLKDLSAMDQYLQQILPEKLRLDQLYIHNRSFLGDLDVIFMTLIMLLPRLRLVKIQEKVLFSGPLSNFINRYLSWFAADFAVAFISISVAGLFWRINNPLNLGITRAITIAFAIALLLSSINYFIGLGRIQWRNASSVYVFDLFLSSTLTVLILVILEFSFFRHLLIPTGLIINFGFLTFIGLVLVRYRERLLFMVANRWVSFRGRTTKIGDRIMIVGAGESGQLTAWLLQKSSFANWFGVVGFVDDDFKKQTQKIVGLPVLGTTREIPEIVDRKKIGVIFFAISKCPPAERKRILSACRNTPARLAIVPDLSAVLERSILESDLGVQL